MHERENALKEWLANSLNTQAFTLQPLAGDASFRRYFRVHYKELTHVVMDAPPEKENLEPFIYIAQTLQQTGIHTPKILAVNKKQGFLLLSDLGDQLLLNVLSPKTVSHYYEQAINNLLKFQSYPIQDLKLASFDYDFMMREMGLCSEWFFKAYLKLNLAPKEIELFNQSIHWVATEIANQPVTFIHRDFHSRNLMVLNEPPLLGVIDFQDAMQGPFTYDLVSLLKDCYIAWPREQVLEWVKKFHAQSSLTSNYSLEEFIRAFDLCGLQRHLKVLGIFSRLHLRDNKPGYLKDLPQTLKYVLECSEAYEEVHPLLNLVQRIHLP